jgi:hypothetical protein
MARRLEHDCLERLAAYDQGAETLHRVLRALRDYTAFCGLQTRSPRAQADLWERYHETLEARPWHRCRCAICRQAGVQVVLFRGTERNKRRGFHNLWVFRRGLTARWPRCRPASGLQRRHERVATTSPGDPSGP